VTCRCTTMNGVLQTGHVGYRRVAMGGKLGCKSRGPGNAVPRCSPLAMRSIVQYVSCSAGRRNLVQRVPVLQRTALSCRKARDKEPLKCPKKITQNISANPSMTSM